MCHSLHWKFFRVIFFYWILSIFCAMCILTINLKLKKSIHYCKFSKKPQQTLSRKASRLSFFCLFKNVQKSDHINIILKHWKVWHSKDVRYTNNLSSVLDHYHIESLFSVGSLQPPSLAASKRPFIQLNICQPALLLELNFCVTDFQGKKTVAASSIAATTFNEGKESYCSHLLP